MKPARTFSAGRHHGACRTTAPLEAAADFKVRMVVVVCMIVNTDAGGAGVLMLRNPSR